MNLKQRIKELGLTQSEIARRLGLHKSTISRMLRGQTNMTVVTALRLARLLEIPVEELIKEVAYETQRSSGRKEGGK